ncbi:MAG: hypothetical protein AB7I30_07350 [Isosphaeraceae bacterium]
MTRSRPFGLADALLLVASTALTLTAARWVYARLPDGAAGLRVVSNPALNRLFLMMAAALLAACLTPAQLAARLRSPRPRFRVIARQPGTAASLAVVIVMAVQGARLVPAFLKPITSSATQNTVSVRTDVLSPFELTRSLSFEWHDRLPAVPVFGRIDPALWVRGGGGVGHAGDVRALAGRAWLD